MVVIICGVAGSGKSVIGRLLAEELGWRFYDADDFHSPDHVEQMRRGIPLTDADRWPWLERLRGLIGRSLVQGEDAALACSALKEAYRRHLLVGDEVKLVYLKGEYALIAERLKRRREHFMNPGLLRSQFDDLEEPRGEAMVLELGPSPRQLVRAIRNGLGV